MGVVDFNGNKLSPIKASKARRMLVKGKCTKHYIDGRFCIKLNKAVDNEKKKRLTEIPHYPVYESGDKITEETTEEKENEE